MFWSQLFKLVIDNSHDLPLIAKGRSDSHDCDILNAFPVMVPKEFESKMQSLYSTLSKTTVMICHF